jgi:hypothetical protein
MELKQRHGAKPRDDRYVTFGRRLLSTGDLSFSAQPHTRNSRSTQDFHLKEGSRNEFKIHVVPFPGESNANSVSIDLVIKYGPVYPRKPPLLRLVPSPEGYSLAPSLRLELDEKLQQQVCEDLPRPVWRCVGSDVAASAAVLTLRSARVSWM